MAKQKTKEELLKENISLALGIERAKERELELRINLSKILTGVDYKGERDYYSGVNKEKPALSWVDIAFEIGKLKSVANQQRHEGEINELHQKISQLRNLIGEITGEDASVAMKSRLIEL